MTKTTSDDVIVHIAYDHEARAQYQRVSDKPVAWSVEKPDGTIVDYDSDGNVVGIESFR